MCVQYVVGMYWGPGEWYIPRAHGLDCRMLLALLNNNGVFGSGVADDVRACLEALA